MPSLKPSVPGPLDPTQRLYTRIADLERQVSNLQRMLNGGAASQIPVVNPLPTQGRLGRIVIFSSDLKLYRDTGTGWVAVG